MSAKEYEFIVVGAGSAGAVLASRLSEEASVLLIEAGPLEQPPAAIDPALSPTLMGSDSDWAYMTTSQAGLFGRSVLMPHGKLVGGSSSMNGMMWTRGDPSDFDGWAQAGAPGWSYADLVPYFRRVEGYADGEGTAMGQTGPLNIESRAEHGINPAAVAFIDAAEQRGHRRLDDFNGPEGIAGAGPIAVNVKDGQRFGAREAYILPAIERPTLEIWADTRVIEVNIEHGRAIGVTLVRDGNTMFIGARREVILSASSVETPKLLMLSGIGPEDHLREIGIPVRHSLPGVGGDFHDHCSVAIPFQTAQDVPLTNFPFDAALFFRSQPDWVGADIEAMCTLRAVVDGEWVGAITLRTGLVRPISRGTIRLQSVDPMVAPFLDPRFLSVDSDIERLGHGVRETLAVAATTPMNEWVTGPAPSAAASADMDDHELRAWVRSHAEAFAHMAGGCRMGLDENAVVDAELKVHGLDGLRIADVSVMPAVPSAHSQAAIMAIAERISDVILGRPLAPHHLKTEVPLA
jgi:choline dehydrogenase